MTWVVGSPAQQWSIQAWAEVVQQARAWLQNAGTRVLATVLDNSPAFLALDEAAVSLGVVHVPLPPFFSAAQCAHALAATQADTLVLSPAAAALMPAASQAPLALAGESVLWRSLLPSGTAQQAVLPVGTVKVTFTSGTTGQPKGVCLTATALQAVAAGVAEALAPLALQSHLSALPYAVLLENVAGACAARHAGVPVLAVPLSALGWSGSSSFDPARFHAAVEQYRPASLMLLPQMLRAWSAYLAHTGQRACASLKFVAVGGAPVGVSVLQNARALGIPVYEGYGLSEGASVQTLNLPWAHRDGSAGRPLPHAQVRVRPDGELEVAGSLYAGYLGQRGAPGDWLPTGDLGRVDEAGYVHIEGRKKHILITAFGRNVSPEWVETTLQQHPAIAQAVVFGDAQPRLSAVVWTAHHALPVADVRAAIQRAIDQANQTLPDYAQVMHWVLGDEGDRTRLFTPNGRPLRDRMLEAYGPQLRGEAVAAITL